MFDSKECEWSDLEIFIDGIKIAKCQGAKYKPAQEKEALHATGNEPFGIQRGNKSYTGTLTFLKGAVDTLNASAKAAGGDSLLDISVVVVINYKAKGSRLQQTDTLISVEFTEYEKGMEQNAKSMPIALPIMFLGLESI